MSERELLSAEELLDAGMKVLLWRLSRKSFSDSGMFGFSVREHIDLGFSVDPLVGVFASRGLISSLHRVSGSVSIRWFSSCYPGGLVSRSSFSWSLFSVLPLLVVLVLLLFSDLFDVVSLCVVLMLLMVLLLSGMSLVFLLGILVGRFSSLGLGLFR